MVCGIRIIIIILVPAVVVEEEFILGVSPCVGGEVSMDDCYVYERYYEYFFLIFNTVVGRLLLAAFLPH